MTNVELSPSEYFEMIKEKKNTITDQDLDQIYDNCLSLLNKYRLTGQTKAMKKLIFHLETIEKEREVVKLGIDTFIYKDDIEEYIDNISKDTVKIIELENYEREVPDDIVEAYSRVKRHFNKAYVVFTDYTGKVERQVEKERRDKDPILFGTFQDKDSQTVIDRFYFIGDWEDEYCDLTLDKMVNEVKMAENRHIAITIKTPEDINELKNQLKIIEDRNGRFMVNNALNIQKKSFLSNITTFFKRKK
jgi:hypothetical protein